MRKKPLKRKVKPKNQSWYVHKLDSVFSKFIRQRDSDKNEIAQCFTCPHKDHWKKLQDGHFCPRQHMATRFSEKNNNAQCYACNMFYGGRPDAYALNLQKKYGAGIIKELHDLARTTKQWSIPELQEKIKYYEEKLKWK